jgi:hypothetical protein
MSFEGLMVSTRSHIALSFTSVVNSQQFMPVLALCCLSDSIHEAIRHYWEVQIESEV